MATARLNRRRYREVVSMLKEVISDQKAPAKQRLQAGQTLLEVYARHDRTEAEKTRRKAAESQQQATEMPMEDDSVDAFLARVKGSSQ